MGMEATHYTIIGYDLTGCKTNKFDDWRWTEEGERFFAYQSKGYIQFFDDGNYLYFGYILSENSEYGDRESMCSIGDIQRPIPYIKARLRGLVSDGVINDIDYEKIRLISFVEWR